VGNYPYSVLVGDFNGDGRPDIAAAAQCANAVSVLLSAGNGAFAPSVPYQGGPAPNSLASADFDGDGHADLAVSDFNLGSVSILLGNGDGSFRPGPPLFAGNSPVSLAVADFNGDGKPDLAVVNRDDDDVSIFLGNGDGSFGAPRTFAAGSQPMFALAADFGGDGIPDLAVADLAGGVVAVLEGNGDGTFRAPEFFASGTGVSSLAVSDFNLDGRPDLVATNSSDDNVSVFLNDTSTLALTTAALPPGTVGSGYSRAIGVAGGTPPYQFFVSSGWLPPGISLDGPSGLLSGTPSAAGTSFFTVSVTDSAGCAASRALSLTISCPPIGVSPLLLVSGLTGSPYSQTFGVAGGTGPYAFSVASGALPPGLALDPSGLLTGTPSASGAFSFSVKAADAYGCYGAQAYALTIATLTGPTVLGVSPDCLVDAGGESVVVTGTNFAPGASVMIAGMPAASVTVDGAGQITAITLPAPAGRGGEVSVTNPDGQEGILPDAVQFDFADVPASNAFRGFICDIARHRITAGCGQGDFCPGGSLLRAAMAVFLLRSSRGAVFVPPPASGFFTDLPADNPFAPWVEEIYNEGIAAGCSSSPLRYCPSSPVSRASMAVFLLRTLQGSTYAPPPATGIFVDVPVSSPFAPWIEQLYRQGITGGCSVSPLAYCPLDSVTRASMAVFLTATFGLQ
jgi:VCBS repeat protein/putative Ig domain-containing protein/IPT/TIG domain-containing protein/FG-GAP repeat protein